MLHTRAVCRGLHNEGRGVSGTEAQNQHAKLRSLPTMADQLAQAAPGSLGANLHSCNVRECHSKKCIPTCCTGKHELSAASLEYN
eukprot:1161592-Pelagomonas_calceolata.AAC.13